MVVGKLQTSCSIISSEEIPSISSEEIPSISSEIPSTNVLYTTQSTRIYLPITNNGFINKENTLFSLLSLLIIYFF